MNLYEGFEVIDKYTFAFHYNTYNNQLIQNWGWLFPNSKEAYEKGSGGDPEQGRIWDREHRVSCGPFKLVEYKRDVHLIWEKFDDYWQEGLPYLDGIKVIYIPDPVTAKAMMEAGEADYGGAYTVMDQIDLVNKGFQKIQGWVGFVDSIWPNTSDPDSVWNDVRLRYALDYAIDKAAVAQAIGMGEYPPLYQLAPPGEWGYRPDYPERRYDPEKAKALLAEAGYPDGLKTTLILQNVPSGIDACTAIKQYLDAVGIETELDVADAGRFFGTVWGTAQPGLSYMWSGMDITNLMTYQRWFSTDPFTDLVYLGHTEEQAQLDAESLQYPDRASQVEITERLFQYLDDGAYLVPIMHRPATSIAAPYVHSDIPQFTCGFVRWHTELVWMEPH
jgi:ABC-type transport system substrate-binding protein